LAALLQAHPEVQYLRIEDGPGLPLGRSFAVKLWPTFVFLSDGQVMARPSAAELAETVRLLTAARPEDSR